MFKRLGIALIVAAAALAAQGVAAEPLGKHFEITPFGGWTWLDGDAKFLTGNPLTDDIYFGGRANYIFHRLLGVEVAGGITPTSEDIIGTPRDVTFSHFSGNLLFTPFNRRAGGPFLFGGAGTARLKPASGETESGTSLEFGGGVRLWLSDAIGLRLEVRDIVSSAEPVSGKVNLDDVVAGAGISFALGGTPRDTDADGVPDRKDRCPDTPRGARVDANGCPVDTDKDGVFDGLDQCPDTPQGAKVDARGCPTDADGDGVFDGLDQCPDTPGGARVDAKGCPVDSDGDGVFDGIDQCENTGKGCQVDEKGCPKDSDGDGVCDGVDQCPDTPAGVKPDEKGCPTELVERETELLDTGMIRLQGINFETNKAEIKAESFPALDVVGQVLTQWPELRIEIGGHTDARGTNAANQKLSLARAKAVEAYLVQKFPALNAAQFTTRGYGESRPIVPNRDETSWALNRRVEFVVLNKDVLKREVEKRRTLMKGEPAPADTTKR